MLSKKYVAQRILMCNILIAIKGAKNQRKATKILVNDAKCVKIKQGMDNFGKEEKVKF